jgi:hypothetical protein
MPRSIVAQTARQRRVDAAQPAVGHDFQAMVGQQT